MAFSKILLPGVCSNGRSAPSFSLLELLIVLAIIAGLTALSLGPFAHAIQSSAIDTAAHCLNDTLAEARQDAVTQNSTVEVRLYDVPGSADPTPAYRAFALYRIQTGNNCPVGAIAFLPATVAVDGTAQHSSLIASDPITATIDPTDSHMNAQTRVFHFLPDGSTDLPPNTSWFITLRAASQSDPAHFPADWASLTIDPVTGRTQIFRP